MRSSGFCTSWKDRNKKHTEICFGYVNDKKLFVIKATKGKKNPISKDIVLSPIAATELCKLMIQVLNTYYSTKENK